MSSNSGNQPPEKKLKLNNNKDADNVNEQEVQLTVPPPAPPSPPALNLQGPAQAHHPVAKAPSFYPSLQLGPSSSAAYRSASQNDAEYQQGLWAANYHSAHVYSQAHHVSVTDAMSQVVPEFNKWKHVRLEGHDSNVGDIIYADKVSICCISLLKNGLYNDTIAVKLYNPSKLNIQTQEPGANQNQIKNNSDENEVVTYNKKTSDSMSHSGDKHVTYGLEHIIDLKSTDEQKFYVISAPWKNSKPEALVTLIPTNPILEIRAENVVANAANAAAAASEPELKRFVIPQDYAESGGYTACVNAEITFNPVISKWKVQIRRDFIMGFADDIDTLVSEVKKLH